MKFTFPLKLIGGLNNTREHWRARHRRVLREKLMTAFAWRQLAGATPSGRLVVTLARIAPRALDSDNLAGRMKAVRDQVATCLGIDDGSDAVEWRYAQRKGLPNAHAVEVSVQARAEWLAEEVARLSADACSTRFTGAPQNERTQSGAEVRTGRRVAPKPRQGPRP